MNIDCCYHCEDRHETCHSHCERYHTQKIWKIVFDAQADKARRTNNSIADSRNRTISSAIHKNYLRCKINHILDQLFLKITKKKTKFT